MLVDEGIGGGPGHVGGLCIQYFWQCGEDLALGLGPGARRNKTIGVSLQVDEWGEVHIFLKILGIPKNVPKFIPFRSQIFSREIL